MRRLTGTLAALVWSGSLAASAARPLPEISIRAGSPLQVALTTVPEAATCAATTVGPLPVRDGSDPLWMAAGPNVTFDTEELHANSLAPLVNLAGAFDGSFHLFVVGAPVGTQIHFTQAGWQPRWPFC
jgi:hypothetical protein